MFELFWLLREMNNPLISKLMENYMNKVYWIFYRSQITGEWGIVDTLSGEGIGGPMFPSCVNNKSMDDLEEVWSNGPAFVWFNITNKTIQINNVIERKILPVSQAPQELIPTIQKLLKSGWKTSEM